jgi:hypothetical protein
MQCANTHTGRGDVISHSTTALDHCFAPSELSTQKLSIFIKAAPHSRLAPHRVNPSFQSVLTTFHNSENLICKRRGTQPPGSCLTVSQHEREFIISTAPSSTPLTHDKQQTSGMLSYHDSLYLEYISMKQNCNEASLSEFYMNPFRMYTSKSRRFCSTTPSSGLNSEDRGSQLLSVDLTPTVGTIPSLLSLLLRSFSVA